ncbi:MAG: hypothetical protein GWP59_08320 [Chlamydiales bacterium]|nr:hypothetical protein [Chlamydiales bacterium]
MLIVIDIGRAQEIYEKEKHLKTDATAKAFNYQKLLEAELQKLRGFTFENQALDIVLRDFTDSTDKQEKKPELSRQDTFPIFLSSYLAHRSLIETHKTCLSSLETESSKVSEASKSHSTLVNILLSFRPFLCLTANPPEENALSIPCKDGETRPYESFFEKASNFDLISDDDEFNRVYDELLKRMLNLYNFIFEGSSKLDQLTLKDFRVLKRKLEELYSGSSLLTALEPILEITENSLEGVEEDYSRLENDLRKQAGEIKTLEVRVNQLFGE